MLALWCAGKLGNCPKWVKRVRFTCLSCRWRRAFYHKFTSPPYWIKYVYKSCFQEETVSHIILDGLEYTRRDGGKLKQKVYYTVLIDPRGWFTPLRCMAIIVFDNIMKACHIKKPLIELCEFLANYPTFPS